MVEGGNGTDAATEVVVTFDDMTVLSQGGVDVFVLNWNEGEDPPPYYVVVVGDGGELHSVRLRHALVDAGARVQDPARAGVAGRRFAFAASTLLVTGHRALLADYLREHQAEGRIPLLVERDGRYLVYLHDPHEGEDEAVKDGDAEVDAGAAE